jgi:hypothetical protein
MIKILEKTNRIIVEMNNKCIEFTLENWEIFKDNLIIDFNEEKWIKDIKIEIPYSAKITPDDLTRSMFYCLYEKHEPNYNNKTHKKLNVRMLLDICNWQKH